MNPPNYICNNSLLNNKFHIQGNLELYTTLTREINEYILQNYDLYKTQEIIKEKFIKIYGEEFYNKNGNAISFIIENEYCNKERQNNFFFDKSSYKEDIYNGVLY